MSAEDEVFSPTDGRGNRYLRETIEHLEKLQRIVESQRPGGQHRVQAQFDELIHRLDVVHKAVVSRGFLPRDKELQGRPDRLRKPDGRFD